MRVFTSIIICLYFLIFTKGQTVETFVTSDYETLYYTLVGKGPKVIFLTGGPGQAVKSLRQWADSLSNDFECILFDQRGTGLSSNVVLDSITINLERATKDLDDLRKHLEEDQLMLCGVSWGGMLAQAYAASFPTNARKIVLISTLGPDLSLFPAFNDNLSMRRYPDEKDTLLYWNNQPDNELSKMKRSVYWMLPYFFNHNLGLEILPDVIKSYPVNEQMSNLMWKDLSTSYNLRSTLVNYKGECIIIRPRQDPIPAEAIYQIKDLLPQTKILIIERSGHMVSFEQPKEFYKILRKVLQ